jgi:hypothetical protein
MTLQQFLKPPARQPQQQQQQQYQSAQTSKAAETSTMTVAGEGW